MANRNDNNNGDAFNNMMYSLGQTVVRTAIAQADEANASWEKVKTVLQMARDLGREQEAVGIIYSAGNNLPQRKAVWWRKQKRLVKMAMDYGIDFSTLSLQETEKAVSNLRRASRPKKEAEADALRMLQRTFKGAMQRTGEKHVLAAIQKEIGDKQPAKRSRSRKPSSKTVTTD